jgi:hypothetical protein
MLFRLIKAIDPAGCERQGFGRRLYKIGRGQAQMDGAARRIAILVLHSFLNMTLSAVMEPLRIANRMAGRQLFDWSVLSETVKPIAWSSVNQRRRHLFARRHARRSLVRGRGRICPWLEASAWPDQAATAP